MELKNYLELLATLPRPSKQIKRIALALSSLVLLWLLFFHWTGVHEVGIRRNIFTGEITLDSTAGFEITPPWVQVALIDTRPQRMCVECDRRSLSCKLVEFNPKGWKKFIENEGFRYYWLSNRISFNSGSEEEYRGMDWVIRGYAFSETGYPFIRVTKE